MSRSFLTYGIVACALVVFCICSGVSVSVVDRSAAGQSASEAYQDNESKQAPSNVSNQDGKVTQINENPLISGNVKDSRIVQQLMQQNTLRETLSQVAQTGKQSLTQMGESGVDSFVANQVVSQTALQSLSASENSPEVFSLFKTSSGEDASEFNKDVSELSTAIGALESQGIDVGCFLLNVNSGQGIAYNLDTRIYGASSFKGIYAAYLSEHLADGQQGLSSSAVSLMDASVLVSDNDAFSSLRNSYDGAGFAEWLESCGVNSDIAGDTHFPRYSARESALLWLHVYRYLETGSDAANHLRELYTQTNVSFIREGVNDEVDQETAGQASSAQEAADEQQSADVQDANDQESAGAQESLNMQSANDQPVVMNKAGWIASTPRFSGLCDAGIIEYDGNTYIMSVMTSAPDSDGHRNQVIDVIKSLFKLR